MTDDQLDHERRIAELERQVRDLYTQIGRPDPATSSGLTFASDRPDPSSPRNDPRLLSLVQTGQTIQAIKLYRELTGAGLADAKSEVEAIATMNGDTSR
jgi:ribosomal protein L7/L12